jgi:hypothetical protein
MDHSAHNMLIWRYSNFIYEVYGALLHGFLVFTSGSEFFIASLKLQGIWNWKGLCRWLRFYNLKGSLEIKRQHLIWNALEKITWHLKVIIIYFSFLAWLTLSILASHDWVRNITVWVQDYLEVWNSGGCHRDSSHSWGHLGTFHRHCTESL